MPTIDFLNSPLGLIRRYQRRLRQRLLITVEGVEPRSKSGMPDADKRRLRDSVRGAMQAKSRRPFRGPIALHVSAETTASNPPHAQTVAKNLLDLLGGSPGVHPRRSLLYKDDSQIQALSVACRHGHQHPKISIRATPFSAFLADLSLAAHAQSELSRLKDDVHSRRDDAVARLKAHLRDPDPFVQLAGKEAYDAWTRMLRREAQQQLLGKGISIWDLACMFGVAGAHRVDDSVRLDSFRSELSDTWTRVFNENPIRIKLDTLPQRPGDSEHYKAHITTQLEAFQRQFRWIVEPLLTPVAMQVIVRPPYTRNSSVLHDLDNVVRDYLVPQFTQALKPPTNVLLTLDLEAHSRHTSEGTNRWPGRLGSVPKSANVGLTKYQAWRMQNSDAKAEGFVSVALVADAHNSTDFFRHIDSVIGDWEDRALC
jgi:Holliday junction resolvase RusA-like endonuclease